MPDTSICLAFPVGAVYTSHVLHAGRGKSGEVMFGPFHARPFVSLFGLGFPFVQLQGWSISDTLNCLADAPKNPLVWDDEACRRLYDSTQAILSKKLGVQELCSLPSKDLDI